MVNKILSLVGTVGMLLILGLFGIGTYFCAVSVWRLLGW